MNRRRAGSAGAEPLLERGTAAGATRRGRQSFWALLDQGISSLTNLVASLAVAKVTTPDEFGRFGIAFVVYLLALTITRGFASNVLAIRYPLEVGRRLPAVVGGVFVLALPVGLIGPLVAWIFEAPLVGIVIAGIPLLVTQDTIRLGLVSDRRAASAAANDAVWLACTAGGIGLWWLIEGGLPDAVYTLAFWVAGALVALIVGLAQMEGPLAPAAGLEWLRGNVRFGRALAFDASVQVIGQRSFFFLVAAIDGAAVLAGFQGAFLLVGPLTVVLQGLSTPTLAEFSRRRADIMSARRVLRGYLLVVAGMGLLTTIVAASLPRATLERLVGDSAAATDTVIVWVAIAITGRAAFGGGILGLRAMELTRWTIRLQILLAAASLGLVVPAIDRSGPRAGAIVYAAVFWAAAVVALALARRALRDEARRQAAPRLGLVSEFDDLGVRHVALPVGDAVGSTVRSLPALVAIDLDGTLLSSDGELSARTATAVRAVVAAGIEVVVVAERPWADRGESGAWVLQVDTIASDKASALAAMARQRRLARDDVLAFGDADDDVGMLIWAGTGVAVGNASREARMAANALVPPNDENGVAQFLERLLVDAPDHRPPSGSRDLIGRHER